MQKKTKQTKTPAPLFSNEEWDGLITRVLGRPNRCGSTRLPYERLVYLTPFGAKVEVGANNAIGRLILSLSVETRELGNWALGRVTEATSAYVEIPSLAALRKLTPERAYELLVPYRAEEAAFFPPHRALFIRTVRKFRGAL
jgi:hypothetical protein